MKFISCTIVAAVVACIPVCSALNISTTGFRDVIISRSTGNKSICVAGYLNVPISVNGTKLNYTVPATNEASTETMVEILQITNSLTHTAPIGTQLIQGNYSIYSRLCLPDTAAKITNIKTVQVLTHGITADNTYWDISPGYSYIDAATDAGYATLSYDQLGVGNSDHPDPIQVVQAASQVAVTHALVQLLRNAKVGGYHFQNIVGVGHSAGSILTQAVTAQYPRDLDAVILTGLVTNSYYLAITQASLNMVNANSQVSGQFRDLPAGYLTPQTEVGIQFAFYRWPNYDTAAFSRQVAHKSTNSIGVELTLGGLLGPASSFAGPVDVVLGANDLVSCGGNCTHPQNQAAAFLSTSYPNASPGSQTFIAAGAGHAIAAHKSAGDSFAHMIDFLQTNQIS
ncbi:catalytic protein [Penicillium angulare]|uniref:Catalytic protein n=1 Tax=Penicillium angulare TaxID=116970 RepID=A0A9W9K019_9EURO|nr:catalytic protein [Penicillium angulare]